MKVIQSELEPQVRAVPVAEASAPARPLRRRPRVMLTPAVVEFPLFHAL